MGRPSRHCTSNMGLLGMSAGSGTAKAAAWYLPSTRDLGLTQLEDGILPGALGSKTVYLDHPQEVTQSILTILVLAFQAAEEEKHF